MPLSAYLPTPPSAVMISAAPHSIFSISLAATSTIDALVAFDRISPAGLALAAALMLIALSVHSPVLMFALLTRLSLVGSGGVELLSWRRRPSQRGSSPSIF